MANAQSSPLELLRVYEQAVFRRDTTAATLALLQMISRLSTLRTYEGLLPRTAPRPLLTSFYTRMAAAISAHASAPDFSLSLPQFGILCANKWVFEAIFTLSGFRSADHLLEHGSRIRADGKVELKLFLALFFSLDDIPDIVMNRAMELPGKHLLPLFLGWLGGARVMTERGEARLRALLSSREKFENLTLPPELLMPLAHGWMLCSYISDPAKHAVKQTLNGIWRNTTVAEGVAPQCTPRRQHQKRPTLVVAAERMLAGHAMHRSYAPCLLQLRQRFHVALLVRAPDYDPSTGALFDETVVIPVDATLRDIAGRLIRLSPDIIYYPSLGMADWTQALANLRFAPIQFMTLGHPATSMADTMDYALIQASHSAAAASFSEKVVVRTGNGIFTPPTASADIAPVEKAASACLHIAVNSHMMKLSASFLATCSKLAHNAKRDLHFHFFPSAMGIRLEDVRSRLADMFPQVTVHESAPYPQFLERLAQCDLALAAFPFGNTNSTVDTCLLGIPTVAFYADEVLSMGDHMVLEAARMPAWLLARDEDGYFEAAMRLIQNDAERSELSHQLRRTDLQRALFAAPAAESETEFVDAVWWMYEHHEALQQSPRHAFTVDMPITA